MNDACDVYVYMQDEYRNKYPWKSQYMLYEDISLIMSHIS